MGEVMTPEEAAKGTGRAIAQLGREPMMWGETYVRGAELGFDGFDFYLYGRSAPLGDVDPEVAASSLVFFSTSKVAPAWEAGKAVMAPQRAALEWAGSIHAWARAHVPDNFEAARLADLASKVVDAAGVGSIPLFAGWRCLPAPGEDDLKARAMHLVNSLRELRGGLHGLAVRAVGLAPIEAIVVHDIWMGELFGWPEPWPDPEPFVDRRREAERLTNELMAVPLSVLDSDELSELVALTNELHEATTAK